MKCPHCNVGIHEQIEHRFELGSDIDAAWLGETIRCPECHRLIVRIGQATRLSNGARSAPFRYHYARPVTGVSNVSAPTEVPDKYAADFNEGHAVLGLSPKASAALSRRALQHLLRDEAKTTKKDLADQIEEVLGNKFFPSHLAEGLDAVRNIGNFAAHPLKSKATGEIVDVEPGEAEWTLEVLSGIFDFLFVEPAKTKARKEALSKKLVEAGKPALK